MCVCVSVITISIIICSSSSSSSSSSNSSSSSIVMNIIIIVVVISCVGVLFVQSVQIDVPGKPRDETTRLCRIQMRASKPHPAHRLRAVSLSWLL